jgi:ABC-2 type transport system ATP-binding protein
MVNQIEIKDITKKFGNHLVLDNVNLSVPQQKIYGIIGESGSGKTTLLKTIVGFWRSDKGKILFEGRDLEKDTKFIRQIVGFATQDNCVYPKLTVKENLEYFGALSNVPTATLKNNIDKVLSFVELDSAKTELAENLSGGMQRRLDIACALIHNPRILILDEPTEDLDPILRRDILKLIKKINADSTTVIITSHLLDETEQLCDEIAILHQGRVLKHGTPEQLRTSFSKDEEILLRLQSKKYTAIVNKLKKHKKKVNSLKVENGSLLIRTKNAEPILAEILRMVQRSKDKLIEVDVRKATLGEVFEDLIKKNG